MPLQPVGEADALVLRLVWGAQPLQHLDGTPKGARNLTKKYGRNTYTDMANAVLEHFSLDGKSSMGFRPVGH